MPVIEQSYDIYIPINKKIKNVIILISDAIYELSNNCFKKTNNLYLVNKDTAQILNLYASVKDSGLQNGSKLILI